MDSGENEDAGAKSGAAMAIRKFVSPHPPTASLPRGFVNPLTRPLRGSIKGNRGSSGAAIANHLAWAQIAQVVPRREPTHPQTSH